MDVGKRLGYICGRYRNVAKDMSPAARHVACSADGSRVGGRDLLLLAFCLVYGMMQPGFKAFQRF